MQRVLGGVSTRYRNDSGMCIQEMISIPVESSLWTQIR